MTLFRRPSRDPLWKDEFPVQSADERYVNRRQFTKFLVLTSLAMFVGNLWILVRSWLRGKPSYPVQRVAYVSELEIGDVKIFSYPGPRDNCILIRTGPRDFVAYSQKCTHLSCAVYYSKRTNRLECPCHEGYFAVRDGRVLQGPPPRPLPRVLLDQRGNDLVAIGMDFHQEE
jgi:nitrite reductase/ring-hydroxylating ferredoxin subunit